MKAGLTLTELAQTLDAQNDAKRDFLVDTRELTLLTPPPNQDADVVDPVVRASELVLPGGKGEFTVRDMAHRQIGDRLKIPAKFYDMLRGGHPALLDHNVNTLFREKPEKRMVRAFVWGDDRDNEARALLSSRYRRRDNFELSRVVLEVASEIADVQVPTSQITETRMYVTLIAPRVQGDVKVGDTVQAGIRITNSEVGKGALKIEPIAYRLICLNGMTVAKAIRSFHIGRELDSDESLEVFSDDTLEKDDVAFFAKVHDAMKAAVDETQFAALIAQLREATTGLKMEKPIEGMEVLAKRYSLSDGERDNVLKHLIEGGDLSTFGALNAVTRSAQDVESYDRSMELEQVGGQILEIAGTKAWEEIARP